MTKQNEIALLINREFYKEMDNDLPKKNFDVIQFLQTEKLNRKIFFPTKFKVRYAFPIIIDEQCTLICSYIKNLNSDKTVVMFYGNGECAQFYEQRSPLVKTITQSCNCNVLIVEYRGYGQSTGTLSFINILKDVTSIIPALGLPEEKIILWGRSLGVFPLIESIYIFSNISGIIIESAFSSLSAFLHKKAYLTSERRILINSFFSFAEKIEKFHGSVLLIHGIEDELVPIYHCGKLNMLFGKQSKNIIQYTPMAEHNGLMAQDRVNYLNHIRLFLKEIK